MTYRPFDVVVVPFPFTDKSATKKRPALVLSSEHFNKAHDHLVLAMITTAKNSDWPTDVTIKRWQDAGLTSPSRIRLKLFSLEQSLILRRLGTLSDTDQSAVQNTLTQNLAV